jgi:hypothetical protein
MELLDAIKARDEAAELICAEFIFPFDDSPKSSPGVGLSFDREIGGFRLVFHLTNEWECAIIIDICEKIGQKISPDIQVTGEIFPYIGGSTVGLRRKRPVEIGDSISRLSSIDAGTLGCFVKKINESKKLLLSCTHVLAPYNQGTNGDLIVQPSKSGSNDDVVAKLDEFIEIDRDLGNGLRLEGAIAEVICQQTLEHVDRSIILKGLCSAEDIEILQVEETRVFKNGSQTGKTSGKISQFGMEKKLNYPGSKISCRYQNFFTIVSDSDKPFAHQGDSGSLIYDEDGYAVGLLIAGNKDATVIYALPIEPILNHLGVELILH